IHVIVERRVVRNQYLHVEAFLSHGFESWGRIQIGGRMTVFAQRLDMLGHKQITRLIYSAEAARRQLEEMRTDVLVLFIDVSKRIQRGKMSIGVDSNHGCTSAAGLNKLIYFSFASRVNERRRLRSAIRFDHSSSARRLRASENGC